MTKSNIHIAQFISLILLLCAYFLSDQPDSLSLMHFDSDPVCQTVISKAIKNNQDKTCGQTNVSTDHHNKHKSKVPRHISFDVILPVNKGYVFRPLNIVQHTCALPRKYTYLFYQEINPPPPKFC